jgi:hypothetical protein
LSGFAEMEIGDASAVKVRANLGVVDSEHRESTAEYEMVFRQSGENKK